MVLRTLRHLLFDDHRAGRAAMLEYRSATAGGLVPAWQVGKPQYPARTIGTYDTGAYRKVALIFRAVQYLADAAGAAPLRVYRQVDDEPQPVNDHPLRQLMQRPNPGMGEARFLAFVAMTMAVTGFVVIEKERNGYGEVINLWPLRSDWLRPIPRQQAAPDWEYRVPGHATPFRLAAEDVIAIPYADTPDASPTGIGPMEVLLREVGITSTMTDFLKTFMDRGAMPLYTLIPSDDPKLARQWEDQSVKDAFMEKFRQRYGGLPRAVEPLPLVGIKDIKPLGFDFNQLAYPALNNLTDARICTGFGIPPILLGAQVGLEQATYSNYGQARTSFYEDTMGPLWTRLDDAFTRHLLPEFVTDPSFDVMFDTSDVRALQDDENDRWNRATPAVLGGAISTHTYHRLLGIKPHGADVFLRGFNVVEVPNTDGQRSRAEAWIQRDTVTGRHGEPVVRERLLPEPRIVTRDGRQYLNERALPAAEREQRARIATTHRDAILRLADVADPVVAGYLTAQRDRIVDALTGERADGTKLELRAVEELDWDAESGELLRVLQGWLDTVGETAFGLAATELSLDDSMWRVSNAYLRELTGLLGTRIVGITETTRADVERVVLDALTEGTSMPDLAEKLRGLFDETYNGRPMAIARTESQVAFNTASVMSYEASGVVSRALLHDNAGHTTDPGGDGLTCSQRNGLIVPLTSVARHVAGEHVNGTLAVAPYVEPVA